MVLADSNTAEMRIAFIHQLPLEIYPPATNALAILARQDGWEVRAWSSANRKGLPECLLPGVTVSRPDYPGPLLGSGKRLTGFLRWHLRVARELARWRPDVVISVEPHSALAVWVYYRFLGGSARLLIHHHEYYAPADFHRPGSRTSRWCHRVEKRDLFARAEWISQTNESRLRMMQADCAEVTAEKGRIWPNHPPIEWIARTKGGLVPSISPVGSPLRLIYVGSLSFDDTFVRELIEWVVAHPGEVSLHVCGYNVRPDVWAWIDSLGADHISTNAAGCAYGVLPELLAGFDVALVLYKGNTLNFVHNVPNKVIEALVCGLEVWYPPEMEGMAAFHQQFPELRLREVDFRRLPEDLALAPLPRAGVGPPVFSAEAAIHPMLDRLNQERTHEC
jgi:hypothetical protein